MRDIELYRTILGLTPPRTGVSVDLDVKGQQVVVKVEAGPGPFRCPECQQEVAGYDRKARRWRIPPASLPPGLRGRSNQPTHEPLKRGLSQRNY